VRSVLITGGAGFIGSNFVRYLLAAEPAIQIVTLDSLTYAGSLENLRDLPGAERHRFVEGDIRNGDLVVQLLREHAVDTIVHFAAESHVDRSIHGPMPFVLTNVVGTTTLLDAARQVWLEDPGGPRSGVRFHHVSTDEVYGSLGPDDPAFAETTPYAPNSPYAASKAGSDHLVRASAHTEHTIERINGTPVLRLRNRLLPLVNLRHLLKLDDTSGAAIRRGAKGRAAQEAAAAKQQAAAVPPAPPAAAQIDRWPRAPRSRGRSWRRAGPAPRAEAAPVPRPLKYQFRLSTAGSGRR